MLALKRLDGLLAGLAPRRLQAVTFLIVAVIGSIDFATGYELSFSIFYLVPVSLAAWYAGRRFSRVVCVVSAVTWLVADLSSGHLYSHPTIPFWNAGVRLGFFVIVASLLARLRSALEWQQRLAERDALTGLANARVFGHRLEVLLGLARRHGHALALGYLDLDGFKGINDRLGHSAGDQVLKAVAATLRQRLRASDLAARLGGDEFAVLLPETDLPGARVFFAALHQNLAELSARHRWPVGYSIGVVVLQSPTVAPDEAIHLADALMYQVKAMGKNSVLFQEVAPS